MEENKKPDNRQIRMGNRGNYNESVGRDYIEGDVYNINNINISQDKNSKVSSEESKSQYRDVSDNQQNVVVNSSGKWIMIKDYFFESTKIRTDQNNKITVKIYSNNAEEEANIRSLRPDRYGHLDTIPFAYRNDGLLVSVERIEEEFKDNICTWSITLVPEDIQYGRITDEYPYNGNTSSYSVAEIAELKGRIILLDDTSRLVDDDFNLHSSDKSMLKFLIYKTNQTGITVDHGVLRKLYPNFKKQPKRYLELSRLIAIFYLKTTNVIEHVIELSLELVESDKVDVKFRGKRRKVDLNEDSTIIEIEGDCILV